MTEKSIFAKGSRGNLVPGDGWNELAQRTSDNNYDSEEAFMALGGAVAVTAAVNDSERGASLDPKVPERTLEAFVEAIDPPLPEFELNALRSGFNGGYGINLYSTVREITEGKTVQEGVTA